VVLPTSGRTRPPTSGWAGPSISPGVRLDSRDDDDNLNFDYVLSVAAGLNCPNQADAFLAVHNNLIWRRIWWG